MRDLDKYPCSSCKKVNFDKIYCSDCKAIVCSFCSYDGRCHSCDLKSQMPLNGQLVMNDCTQYLHEVKHE